MKVYTVLLRSRVECLLSMTLVAGKVNPTQCEAMMMVCAQVIGAGPGGSCLYHVCRVILNICTRSSGGEIKWEFGFA